jgi:hypothetical protein
MRIVSYLLVQKWNLIEQQIQDDCQSCLRESEMRRYYTQVEGLGLKYINRKAAMTQSLHIYILFLICQRKHSSL